MKKQKHKCVTHRNALGDLGIVLLVLKKILGIEVRDKPAEYRVGSVLVIGSTRARGEVRPAVQTGQPEQHNESDQDVLDQRGGGAGVAPVPHFPKPDSAISDPVSTQTVQNPRAPVAYPVIDRII